MRQYRKWTKEEIETVLREYPYVRAEDLAKKLNRPCGSIYRIAKRFGIRKDPKALSRIKTEVSPSRKRTMEIAKQIMREISKEDLIYIAGLFDGEGSVTLYEKRDKYRIKNLRLEAQIANTHKETLEWIKDLFKLGSVYKGARVRKQTYHYFVGDWQAAVFLTAILPYLKIKKAVVQEKLRRWLEQYGLTDLQLGEV